uniref:Kinesin-like protein n=1 Tax=Scleropages formosus TaxID=113540 RepID=A0A8C9VE40_SCLFO
MSGSSSFISKKEEKAKNIQVVVRCRPFSMAERKSSSHSVVECDHARREVTVRTGGVGDKSARKTYTFDMVFGPSAKQIEVYRSVVCPILDEVIMGYNCTVFAYGQTGTGKTFTMEGERSPNEEFTWEETLWNLFFYPSPDVNERLQMFDDPRNKRGVIIKGLEEVSVHNKDEVYQILERGAAKRKTASTLMNAYSSRSHSVFSITIHMKETTVDGEELVKIGKLNLVDLAGSENIGRSGAVDKRAREAGNINQSLLTLGRVITALVERTPHVPYRESKLTRILQDSLGGRTKTSIIATVSPASVNLEETLSTLEYASRAKNILNKPEVNQKLTKRALIKEYTEEIERLKRDLAAARDKNGVYLSTENFDIMNSKLVAQEEHIVEFTEKISALEEEMKRVAELFSDSKRDLELCTEELQELRRQLEATQQDLRDTRMRLSEEEFLVSELESTESKLYDTAGKLLSTIKVSTKDVTGLHEKLDRKKAVEQHNAAMQQSFADQMEASFSHIQKSIEEQSVKHQGMLDFYSESVGEFHFNIQVHNSGSRKTGPGSCTLEPMRSMQQSVVRFYFEQCVIVFCPCIGTSLFLSSPPSYLQGIAEVISCLQNQLNLLGMDTKNDFGELLNQSNAVQLPVKRLQQDVHSAAACQSSLESSANELIVKVHQVAEEGKQVVEEFSGQSGFLRDSVNQVAEKSALWHEAAVASVASFTKEQLLHICVEESCEDAVTEARRQLQLRHSAVEETLIFLEKHITSDRVTAQQYEVQLSDSTSRGLSKVHTFLTEELKRDVPTGQTPQRKDYVYPRVLEKTQNRNELLEHFRKQQQELQEALSTYETVKEEQVDQDSLEDEVSTCNDSAITEHSCIEETMMCNESGRAPFFKHKRGGKKENKSDRSKMENEKQSTPPRSKLPLRVQN